MNKTILNWFQSIGIVADSQSWLYWIITLSCIVVLVYIVNLICSRLIIPTLRKLTHRTVPTWDDILFNDTLFKDISRLLPPILIAVLLPIAFVKGNDILDFLLKVNYIYLVVVVAKLLCTFISALYDLSMHHERLKNHALQSIYQMLKIVVICVALIIVVSILINKNPGYILTALGASAAVLMLVFKDMIVGLVAGVQLSMNDMLGLLCLNMGLMEM